MEFLQKNLKGPYIRILSGAEPFGYGPCSKLIATVKELKKEMPSAKISFLGDGSALNYALYNNYIFSSVQEYDGVYPNPDDFDLVVSVMNPYMVFWGWFNHKKCIYIDSLYWFWKFETDYFAELELIIEQLKNAESLEEMWAIVKNVSGHNLHYIAHKLANISCSQYFGDVKNATDIFRKSLEENVVCVNPMIDMSYKKPVEKDTILISLGGLLSPLNQEKEALAYVSLVMKITEDFIAEAAKKYKIILATNPEVVKSIKKISPNINVTTLSQKEMLKTINRSIVVLTPAGITTMYECLMYEVPIFILPELHDGHYPNYLRLAGDNQDKINSLNSVFPNALISLLIDARSELNPDNEILRIQSIIKMLNITNNKTVQSMRYNVSNLLELISDQKKIATLAKKQSTFVLGEDINKNKRAVDVINEIIIDNRLPRVIKKYMVGIISSATSAEIKDVELFTGLGKTFAMHGINIATGAAIGISHIIGKGAKDAGSKLVGFSPNANSLAHSRQSNNAPISHFDVIHFNGNGFTARSLEFINTVDALIMVSGRMGTLSEFTIGLEEGVPIFVLKGFGGISDHIEEIISYGNKAGLIPPTVANNVDELIDKLLQLLNLNYYK